MRKHLLERFDVEGACGGDARALRFPLAHQVEHAQRINGLVQLRSEADGHLYSHDSALLPFEVEEIVEHRRQHGLPSALDVAVLTDDLSELLPDLADIGDGR